MTRSVCCAVLAVGVTLAGPPSARAQTVPASPAAYAVTNARIVVAPGRVLERGTVVIRQGRVEAVGAEVAVPPDAYTLDASGLTVYPGLIDAASGVGMPRPQTPAGAGGPAAFLAAAQASSSDEPPEELRAWREAADIFKAGDVDLEAMRANGITTVGLTFTGGILPGKVSVASVGEGPKSALIVRTPAAQQVAFNTRRGAYPSTLMGSIAYVRQAFYDADHLRRREEAFRRDPGSVERPVATEQSRALIPAVSRQLPVWFAVSRENDLKRALDVGEELNLDFALLGALEGYRIADRLARAGRPVLVSLAFPAPRSVTGRAFELHVTPVDGPDTARASADSAVARAVRGNAAALARSGVPIALTSFGLDRPADFRERVIQAVEAGLSPDDALRALTITPARLLGLERALGTVETGKLANLVIVEGDLFSREGRVRHVFVEGRRFDVREAPRREGGSGRAAASRSGADATVALAGAWRGTVDTGDGSPVPFTLRLEHQGSRLRGTMETGLGAATFEGSADGPAFTLEGELAMGGQAIPLSVTGRVEDRAMRGTISASGMGTFTFTATREPGGNP